VVLSNGTVSSVSDKYESTNERTHKDYNKIKINYIFYGCVGSMPMGNWLISR